MWYKPLLPWPFVLIPILVMTSKCHTPKNNSDVIVTYSGHSEADSRPRTNRKSLETSTEKRTTKKPKPEVRLTDFEDYIHFVESETEEVTETTTEDTPTPAIAEDVVFVPNEDLKEVIRNEEYLLRNRMELKDVMGSEKDGRVETEAPQDIIFVNGKNNENQETFTTKAEEKIDYLDVKTKKSKNPPEIKLNCTNLNCDNTIKSICGGKKEHNKMKYRLFKNECFFRKVNCNFKKKENRYTQVSVDSCRNIAVHVTRAPLIYEHRYWKEDRVRSRPKPVENVPETKREISRRSLTMNVEGVMCSHACPATCPDDYEPTCAVSGRGERRVFLNHCKMDANSCTFSIVWRLRPLAECVGGKKADMRQNRGFINWMQTVGIVDRKGRLMLKN